jgi:type IV secretion system protein TrbE
VTTLARLGSGWVSWIDAVRMPASAYSPPEASAFPDPITALIDEERRQHFMLEGNHYESEYALVLQYTPPLRRNSKVADLIYDDKPEDRDSPAVRILAGFKRALDDLEDTLGDSVKLRRMHSYNVKDRTGREHMQDELVNYLQICVCGESTPINVPPVPMYMDAYLGNVPVWAGDTPKIGEKFVTCVALDGFPAESYPGILDVLDHMAISYRWSSRFIYMDQHEALSDLRKYRRKWKQQVRGFWTQVFRTQNNTINEDAIMMARQTDDAITDASSAMVTFGYYTPVIVLMGEKREEILESARTIVREVRRDGFNARIETVNTMESWLGTLPGHPYPNIRRPLIHTLSLSDMLPLASVWPGLESNPCPLYPPNSPPLLHAATAGATPFRLNLHVGDLGHTLIFGPTGAGKSTLLATIAAQFRRYPNSKITSFDKGRSMMALTLAVGGQHYDLAGDAGSPGLCPLAFLETDGDAAWAEEWLSTCFELQSGQPATPRQKEEIHRAIRIMRSHPEGRSLTDFITTIQNADIRSALAHYTIDGPLGKLLDNRQDELRDASFSVFEIEDLMALGERSLIPVLLYLFRRFETSLTGQPALLLLDEAWVMLGHPTFREKIREWLKVLRKANCAVVLATQSLSDAVKSGLLDVLLEACPTKILLPNEEADKAGTEAFMGPRDLYALFGLNDTQINIIQTAVKKRHYYYISPEGRRLFDLSLGPVALSFVAVSDKKQVKRVRELARQHGERWPYQWLKEREVQYDEVA